MVYPLPLYQTQHNSNSQTCNRTHITGNYGQSVTSPVTPNMKIEVDGPNEIAERSDTMNPPTSIQKPKVTSPSSFLTAKQQLSENGGKRRQSRFDPMDSDAEDEGYEESGHRHPFRKISEDEKKDSFTLPGIKSLLNPTNDREHNGSASTSASISSFQSSLPSLVSNSPGGSPSTIRSSRYSSLASGTSMSEAHSGWWNSKFGGPASTSQSAPHRVSPIPPNLQIVDDHDAKRRRSDQSPVVRDLDEQNRLRWLAQSRNASFPITGNGASRPGSPAPQIDSRMMHPPSAPISRGSISHHDSFPFDRRPSASSRTLSLVSGSLTQSFADLSATEREKERERQGSVSGPTPSHMPPPYPAPPGTDRRGSSLSVAEVQQQRSHTATPPERFRAQTNPPNPNSPRSQQHRSSLSEMIKAQSGDGLPVPVSSNRYETHPMEKASFSEPGAGWQPSRRSSSSSTRSASTPGMTVTLNSDDGHPPHYGHRQYYPAQPPPGPGDSMSGMDVLAESARRVSEQEQDDYRRATTHVYPGEDRDVSPKPGQAGPKYQCAYCTKTFSRPSSLRIHTYSHTGERPYICQEPSCGRRFSVQSNLKRHAKVHVLGSAGGASLNQLHGNSTGMHQPPIPGQSYYAQGGYPYDNRYPQPHPGGAYAQPQHGQPPYRDTRYEEDELEEDELEVEAAH